MWALPPSFITAFGTQSYRSHFNHGKAVCRQLCQQYIGVEIADSLNPSNASDKGGNNLIVIDPRDQHGQSGKFMFMTSIITSN